MHCIYLDEEESACTQSTRLANPAKDMIPYQESWAAAEQAMLATTMAADRDNSQPTHICPPPNTISLADSMAMHACCMYIKLRRPIFKIG